MLRRGVTGTVVCPSGPCDVEATATVDPRSLKKLGLWAVGTAVFRATTVTADGKTKVVLRLSAAAKRKLKKAKSLKLKVRIVARDGTQAVGITRRVTIKR